MAKLDSQSKPASSVTSSGVPFSPPSIDFRQPFACIPYAEPCQGGMLFSYGSHAVLNPNGHANPRVPLPRQPSDEELIYVNPKQYHGILRRRHLRAKLEAQNKLNKGRKPYLHESRHLHAMRRVRGSGGRFVNTKQVQQHHEKALHTPFQKSGNKTDLTTSPSSNVANLFCQNQSNYSNQNNYSSHNSYNREFSGEHMHQWVSTRLP
ncbi:hypothetical protein LUZ63_001259 [Rhynchospora breviuscula]|uniref:Nuclear transcription factor Y subunit n=1 Tax=Rhynchospora breviuscula TaxID=2022672 RepID=A0A9Q0CX26_9POAL|nr:hypothetical protein LUZ63_001259 [Rhynchospora breviuscula]